MDNYTLSVVNYNHFSYITLIKTHTQKNDNTENVIYVFWQKYILHFLFVFYSEEEDIYLM